jgi:hypothetical protein
MKKTKASDRFESLASGDRSGGYAFWYVKRAGGKKARFDVR